jgi:cell division protease FtsH
MRLARQTPMFSGADLAAIINEAALNATMSNKEAIEMVDLEEARDKLKFGKARKSRVIDEKEKEIVAWHEAGHALVQALETEYDPLHKVSIVSRGRMGGAAFTLPEKDRMFYGKRYWEAYLRICYGGRVAEELFCGDIGTGASMDIQQASSIARSMVTEWGMSDVLGPVRFVPDEGRMSFFGEQPREHSDKTAEIIDAEVHALIARAYDQTKKILSEKKDELRLLKDALLRYETIDGEDVKRIITGQPINKPTVTDLIASELQRRTDAKREAERRPDSEGPTAMPQPG